MALDLTCLATVQANRQSFSSCSVGCALGDAPSTCSRVIMPLSRSWISSPPAITATVWPPRAGSGRPPVSSRRRFFFRANAAIAASSASGATTTSVKMSQIASAVAPSSVRLTATMPPKAETLSQASACCHASSKLSRAGDAAGVGVLDDHDRGRAVAKFGDELQRGIGIVQIIVAQLLALYLPGLGDARASMGPTAGRAPPSGVGFRRSAASIALRPTMKRLSG